MYCKHHTKGVVVSSRIEGDSNKLINIFTENFGLINAKVQGARNLQSKLRSGSQDFSLGEFSLVRGKTGWRVVSSRADKNLFEEFKDSPEKLKMVGNILNLIKKLVAEEEAHHSYNSVFNIVSNFFKFLEKATNSAEASSGKQEKDIALAECLTLVRILHALGYMRNDPELAIPISHNEIQTKDLELIAPKRSQMISLINESLKAT
jgi:recombinational DNA repair protein (RecF pathway)